MVHWIAFFKNPIVILRSVCIINISGVLVCKGDTYGINSVPSGYEKSKYVFSGQKSVCAINNSNNLKCWGNNLEGQTNTESLLTKVFSCDICYRIDVKK